LPVSSQTAYQLPFLVIERSFGLFPDETDPQWKEWKKKYIHFYQSNQKEGIGKRINSSGYEILRKIDWRDKSVVEIGPGLIPHMDVWDAPPGHYTAVDIDENFLSETKKRLHQAYPDCPFTGVHKHTETQYYL